VQLQKHRLTFSIAAEDCASRSLNTEETAESSRTVQEKNSEMEMNDDEWKDESGAYDSGEENEVPVRQSRGLSEYEKKREKNIEELKTILAGLNSKYPTLEDLTPRPAVKKSVSRKKKDDTPVERRVSTRIKGKDNVDKG
jgi:hypothetical protein